MDFRPPATTSTPVLTAQLAQAIYELIKEHGNADLAFKAQDDSAYDPEHFAAVEKEWDRVTKELREYAGGKIIEPAEYEINEETGEQELVSEEVRYELTTQSDLVAQVDSALLDVADVLNDIEPNGLWADFKALYS
jgi:hypothetical protein